MKTKPSLYLVLTVILVILSIIGGIFLFQIINKQDNTPSNSSSTAKIELIPTDVPQISVTPVATTAAKISPTPIASPTSKIKVTPTATPTAIPTKKVTPTITPTTTSAPSATLTYSSSTDGFSVDYSSTRKVYQDTESSGNRYTFSLSSGNFAVHIGLNDKWAWTAPNRNFSGDLIVAGQNTYRYDISNQTIVDLQSNGKNYTIQCVHNGKESLKTECESFISSFKLL
ncbi:MAG: hypothetical protein WDA13_04145 [Candidatus Shapirobacteria bacterium]